MNYKKIHFTGIGGSGMNALARLLIAGGASISGSDAVNSPVIEKLIRLGATVKIGHNAGNLPPDTEVLVRSAAIPEDNDEVATARSRGVIVLKYAEMLGRLMQNRAGVGISGTHGKTTTTGMVAHALIELGKDPTVVVGGVMTTIGGSSKFGTGDFFVAEACEYDRSFHNLPIKHGLITNVEAEHLDYFSGGLSEIVETFGKFVAQIPPDGSLAVCNESKSAMDAAKWARCKVVSYGKGQGADFQITRTSIGRYYITANGKKVGEFNPSIAGEMNALNALGAVALLSTMGIDIEAAIGALESFCGMGRRFEKIASNDGIVIYDDYAHHPTEIAALIDQISEAHSGEKTILIYQPHQISRTRLFFNDIARQIASLSKRQSGEDIVIITPIFVARDGVSGEQIALAEELSMSVNDLGLRAITVKNLEQAADEALLEAVEGAVIITVGAGDVYKAGLMIKEKLLSGD